MKITVHTMYIMLLLSIAGITCTTALVIPRIQNKQQSFTKSFAPSHPTKLQVLWDPLNSENDSGYVEFPTPSQRSEIKKEAKRRRARRQMPRISFSDDETNGPWSDETIQAVWEKLTETEMIELKGICRQDIRDVYQTARWFCEEIEDLIAPSSSDEEDDDGDEGRFLPVALISTKGHTALIYCPTLPLDHPNKFILRTSVGQKNVWKARPKPLRDISGQIIREPKPEDNN